MKASPADEIGAAKGAEPNAWLRRLDRAGGAWLLAAGAGVLACFLLARAAYFWVFTLDDAFITLRYSRHLAQGLGPSWNPGATPAEGYTTTLWMLILALAEAARADGPSFAKGVGVLFALGAYLAAATLSLRAARSLAVSPRRALIAPAATLVLFIAYWPLSLHAVSGMETTLSCFVLSLFFWQSLELETLAAGASPQTTCRRLALSALACCLTRPEAALPCAVTLLAHLVRQRDHRLVLLRTCVLWLALPFGAYYLLRWLHFGLLFPLSFYVKARGQPLFSGLPDVLDFFAPFVREQPWWFLLIVLGAARTRALVPSLLGALSFVLFFIFPEHIMAFEGRYLLPLFPFLAACAGVGAVYAGELMRALPLSGRARRGLEGALVLALALLAALPLPADPAKRSERWLAYGRQLQAAHVALARDLKSGQRPGARIALLDVGAIGYYADWHTIDTFGLNDAHVALTRRTDVGYVLAQEPDLLVVVSAEAAQYREVFAWETPLYEAARKRGYQPLCSYQFEPDYQLQVLARQHPPASRASVCASATHK